MKKQRAGVPNDPNIKTQKIPKYSRPISNQNENVQSPNSTQIWQTPSQFAPPLMNLTQIIDQTGDTDNLDHLMEIWNLAKENKITLSQDQPPVCVTELNNHLTVTNSKIHQLQKTIYKEKERHKALAKVIEDKCKIQEEIIENQNRVKDLRIEIQEHMEAITRGLGDCYKSRDFSTDLYNVVSAKQQRMIDNLTEKLKNCALDENKKLEDELELKTKEFLINKTECDNAEEEMKGKLLLLNEINNELEETKSIIENIDEKHNEAKGQTIQSIKELEVNVYTQKETKSKLIAGQNEISQRYNELSTKYEALKIQDKEHVWQIEKLQSTELELKRQESKLDNDLDELKNIHFTITSENESQTGERLKELQDLRSALSEAVDKLEKTVPINEELSQSLALACEKSGELQQISENRNTEMTEIRADRDDILAKTERLAAIIEAQNVELIGIDEDIRDKRENSETLRVKRSEIIQTEAELLAELATTEQQLSDKRGDLRKLRNKGSNEISKFSNQIEKLRKDIEEKNDLIAEQRKTTLDLKRKAEHSRSELNKKIQKATITLKKYENAGYEKRMRDQNSKIETLKRELEAEKRKQNEFNTKKTAAKKRNKAKLDNELKKVQLTFANLETKLIVMKEQNVDLVSEISKIEASREANTNAEKKPDVNTTPKPILKSAITKNNLPKVQKVQFDLGERIAVDIDMDLETHKETERRDEAPIRRIGPDWTKLWVPQRDNDLEILKEVDHQGDGSQSSRIQVLRKPSSIQDASSPIVAETQGAQTSQSQTSQATTLSQPRKFFKHPRPETKTNYRFGWK